MVIGSRRKKSYYKRWIEKRKNSELSLFNNSYVAFEICLAITLVHQKAHACMTWNLVEIAPKILLNYGNFENCEDTVSGIMYEIRSTL